MVMMVAAAKVTNSTTQRSVCLDSSFAMWIKPSTEVNSKKEQTPPRIKVWSFLLTPAHSVRQEPEGAAQPYRVSREKRDDEKSERTNANPRGWIQCEICIITPGGRERVPRKETF